jgi:hypothetical protein
MVKIARLGAAMAAVMFLATTAPVSAQDEYGCQPCQNCYPGLFCYQCDALTAGAVANCCGNGAGWSFCVNNEWGFFAQCGDGGRCHCNDEGGDCETLPRIE